MVSRGFDCCGWRALGSIAGMEARVETRAGPAATVCQAQVLEMQWEGERTACILSEGGRVLVSNFLAAHIRPGDQINFPVVLDSVGAGTEIYIRRTSPSACSRPSATGSVVVSPFFCPSGPRLRTALPVASRIPSGSSGPFCSAATIASQRSSISFSERCAIARYSSFT